MSGIEARPARAAPRTVLGAADRSDVIRIRHRPIRHRWRSIRHCPPGAALDLQARQHVQRLETEDYNPSIATVSRDANTGASIERHAVRPDRTDGPTEHRLEHRQPAAVREEPCDRATVGGAQTARAAPFVANRRHKWR